MSCKLLLTQGLRLELNSTSFTSSNNFRHHSKGTLLFKYKISHKNHKNIHLFHTPNTNLKSQIRNKQQKIKTIRSNSSSNKKIWRKILFIIQVSMEPKQADIILIIFLLQKNQSQGIIHKLFAKIKTSTSETLAALQVLLSNSKIKSNQRKVCSLKQGLIYS